MRKFMVCTREEDREKKSECTAQNTERYRCKSVSKQNKGICPLLADKIDATE